MVLDIEEPSDRSGTAQGRAGRRWWLRQKSGEAASVDRRWSLQALRPAGGCPAIREVTRLRARPPVRESGSRRQCVPLTELDSSIGHGLSDSALTSAPAPTSSSDCRRVEKIRANLFATLVRYRLWSPKSGTTSATLKAKNGCSTLSEVVTAASGSSETPRHIRSARAMARPMACSMEVDSATAASKTPQSICARMRCTLVGTADDRCSARCSTNPRTSSMPAMSNEPPSASRTRDHLFAREGRCECD